eukprot:TRINITY_DN1524_c2_g2_i1.p1 TRINITY_DN1524_c2_g2~~TRINITY_DN1524_c2_g2_i1.p1  ORF type:complete len:118 (-),score=32.75 TRINITY_DN1524_c2_g2_i1:111-431(-)
MAARAAALCLLALSAADQMVHAKANAKSKSDRKLRERTRICESAACAAFPQYENMNCVNACISTACYETIYAAEPLEDGEVDPQRTKLFNTCFRNEQRFSQVRPCT